MRNWMAAVVAISTALMMASPVQAHLSLKITADEASKVYLGGKYVGKTPLNLNNIKVGEHSLVVRSDESGEEKRYTVTSTKARTSKRNIHADFSGQASAKKTYTEESYYEERPVRRTTRYVDETYVAPRRYVYEGPYRPYSTYSYEEPYYAAPPVRRYDPYYGGGYYGDPYYGGGGGGYYGGDPYYRRRGDSTDRFRNVIIGGAIANEVFNRGGSRRDWRRGLVGAGLLNELVGGGGGGLFR